MNDPQQLVARFDQSVPPEAQKGIVRAINSAYSAANEIAKKELDQRMWPQAWGYLRWLKVDSELLSVGERFGRVARFASNTEDTHLGHTELHFGDLVLTAACVQSRGRRPRAATYRDLFAESNQALLFEEMRQHITGKNKIWAVVMHVSNVAAKVPLHIDVGFFAKDRSLAAPLIDLKKRAAEAEIVIPQVLPKLRVRRDTGA